MDDWLAYGVPAGAMVIAALGWVFGLVVSRSFTAKYPTNAAEYAHLAPGE